MEIEKKELTTETILEEMTKAKNAARKIHELTIGVPFTKIKLMQLQRNSPQVDVEKQLSLVSKYGFLRAETKNGIQFYNVNLDDEKRVQDLETMKAQTLQTAKAKCDYWSMLQELIQQEIEDGKAETGVPPDGKIGPQKENPLSIKGDKGEEIPSVEVPAPEMSVVQNQETKTEA